MSLTTKKLLLAALAIIFTSALLEVGARFFAFVDQPLVSGNQLFEEKFFVMRHLDYSKKPTIFLMGDSTMSRAVYPDLLSALLEKRGLHVQVVNLAFDGGLPPSALKLLEAADLLHIKPSLVLYDFTGYVEFKSPFTVAEPVKVDQQAKSIEASYMGRCILCKRKRTIGGLLCWLEDNSIFIRNRSYFKQRFLDFIKTLANARLYEWMIVKPFSDHDMIVSNLGWNPNHFLMSEESLAVDIERQKKQVEAQTISNPSNLSNSSNLANESNSYLDLSPHDHFRNFCTSHQIKYAMVWLPQYDAYRVSGDASLLCSGRISRDWAENTFEKSANPAKNLYTFAIRGMGQDMMNFNDPLHVSTYGAIEATRRVANVLSQSPYREMLENPALIRVSASQQ